MNNLNKILKNPIAIVGIALILLSVLVAIGFVVASTLDRTSTVNDADREPMFAVLESLEGTVSVSDNGTELAAEISENIYAGSVVITDQESRAELVLPDGSYLRLDNDTEVVLSTLNQTTSTVEVAQGNVYVRLSDRDDNELLITTADAEYFATGTAFMIQARESTSNVYVYHSKVTVTKKASGDRKEVPAGSKYVGEQKQVSQIDNKKLTNREIEFTNWNEEKDKQVGFENALGELPKVRKTESSQSEETKTETSTTSQPVPSPAPAPAPTPAPTAPEPEPAPESKTYPTGPAPLFPNYYQAAYQEYGKWLDENPNATCAATLYNLELTDGTKMELWSCGSATNGGRMAVQYVPGRGGARHGPFENYVIPVLLPSGISQAREFTKYNNQRYDTPYTGPSGHVVRFAPDAHIDSLLASGIL